MKKKSILMAAIAVMLVAVLVVGGTLGTSPIRRLQPTPSPLAM